MGHDSQAEREIGMYEDENAQMDVWGLCQCLMP